MSLKLLSKIMYLKLERDRSGSYDGLVLLLCIDCYLLLTNLLMLHRSLYRYYYIVLLLCFAHYVYYYLDIDSILSVRFLLTV